MPVKELPGWSEELTSKYKSGIAHTFAIHLNTQDYVPCGDSYLSLEKFFVNKMLKDQFLFIAFYDRANGLRFVSDEKRQEFIEALKSFLPAATLGMKQTRIQPNLLKNQSLLFQQSPTNCFRC